MKRIKTLCGTLLVIVALLASGDAHEINIPVLMYHNLTGDPAQVNSMTVTDERFRLDMEYLQQMGYTPLLPQDLTEIQSGAKEIPENPVMITFDDGYRSNYQLGYPLLKQTGMKAVIAVVTSYMQPDSEKDAENRGFMTWSELREMHADGTVEIGSHSHNLHNPDTDGNWVVDGANGIQRQKGESQSAYAARVGEDLETSLRLIRDNVGQSPVNYFAYPFGAYDSGMPPLLKENGVSVSSLTASGVANIASGFQKMPRLRITQETPVAEVLRQYARAVPTLQTVNCNGTKVKIPCYNIRGSTYVRVRDVAALLSGTEHGFDVQWNGPAHRVELTPDAVYTPLGSEFSPLGTKTRSVSSSLAPTFVSGVPHMVAAFVIDENTCYKLRGLSEYCGFAVNWDEATRTIQIVS